MASDIVVTQAQPPERLANREDIGTWRGSVFLEAEDNANLLGGIGSAGGRDMGRGFDDVVENGLTGLVFELGLGGPTASHGQDGGETAKRSIHRIHRKTFCVASTRSAGAG
jgi:hypothetical protein